LKFNKVHSIIFIDTVDYNPELDMGPFCKIQSNPIQQLNDTIQSNPLYKLSVNSKKLNHGCTFVKH